MSCWVARQRHVEYPTAGERFGDQLTEFEQHYGVVFQPFASRLLTIFSRSSS